DAHVPVAFDDGTGFLTPVHPEPQPFDAVTECTELGVEAVRGGVAVPVDDIGSRVSCTPAPHGGCQKAAVVDGTRAVRTGSVVQVLSVYQQSDALCAPLEGGGCHVGAH